MYAFEFHGEVVSRMQMLTFTDFRCAQRFAVLCNSFVCISPLLYLRRLATLSTEGTSN